MVVDYYLAFPSRDVALAVYAALARLANPDLPEDHTVETFPPDGVYGANRYDIVDVGTVYAPTGEVDEEDRPIMAALPGYRMIGRFRGPDPLPPELEAFVVEPWNQVLG
jgi:hypothetical protein